MLTWSWNGRARVWDGRTGKSLTRFMKQKTDDLWETRGATVSRDGTKAVIWSGSNFNLILGGFAQVWDLRNGRATGPPLKHDDAISGAELSTDGRHILTWSRDKTARLWNSQTGQLEASLKHEAPVLQAAFTPDQLRILTFDGYIHMWDRAAGEAICPPTDHTWKTTFDSFAIHGNHAVSWGFYGISRLDSKQRTINMKKLPLKELNTRAGGAVFSEDGRWILVWLLTGPTHGQALVLESASGAPVSHPLEHRGEIFGGRFNADGSKVLTWSADRTARLWDPFSGRELIPPLQHGGRVWGAVFDQDERRILTWSEGMARLWDSQNGEPLTLPLRGIVSKAVFSKDQGRILAISTDGMRLWDDRTGTEIIPFQGFRLDAQDVAHGEFVWREEGQRVLEWRGDGAVRVWNLVTDEEWPREELQLRLEVHTGTRLNQFGEVELLSGPEWRARRSAYEEILRLRRSGAGR